MDWIVEHQIKGKWQLILTLAGAALLLGLITWVTLLASAPTEIVMLAVFLPIIVVPLLIGLSFGFFTLESRSILYFIPPFLTYLVLVLYDTIVGLLEKNTEIVRMSWVYFPFLVLATGLFMTLGSFIAKLVIAKTSKEYELVSKDDSDG